MEQSGRWNLPPASFRYPRLFAVSIALRELRLQGREQELWSRDEIVQDLLIESGENLDRLDQDLVKLEGEPWSKDPLASIFRTIHTINRSCGLLGFARLEKVACEGGPGRENPAS